MSVEASQDPINLKYVTASKNSSLVLNVRSCY